VVEGTGLENRQAGNRLVGSNPTPSAIFIIKFFVSVAQKINCQIFEAGLTVFVHVSFFWGRLKPSIALSASRARTYPSTFSRPVR
jgi:hypothetical protein